MNVEGSVEKKFYVYKKVYSPKVTDRAFEFGEFHRKVISDVAFCSLKKGFEGDVCFVSIKMGDSELWQVVFDPTDRVTLKDICLANGIRECPKLFLYTGWDNELPGEMIHLDWYSEDECQVKKSEKQQGEGMVGEM